jgi:hypothetical protein
MPQVARPLFALTYLTLNAVTAPLARAERLYEGPYTCR